MTEPQEAVARSGRRQVIALLVVLTLGLGLLLLRPQVDPNPTGSDLTEARRSAALAPCPSGLGPGLPARELPCLGGGPDVSLTAPGTGRPALVTIWATWCGPCVREVPLLQEVADRTAGRLDVVGVLHQDQPGNALEFARQIGMRYASVVDEDGDVLRAFGSGPPITVLVRADGTVAQVRRGELADLAEIDDLLSEHLGLRVGGAA